MASTTESRSAQVASSYSLALSVLAYAIVCVPVYFWLEGPVGQVGSIEGSVAAIGLAIGAILFVPIVKASIENRTSRLGPRREGGYEDDRGAESPFEHATESSAPEETDG
jgi:hypothetical protein